MWLVSSARQLLQVPYSASCRKQRAQHTKRSATRSFCKLPTFSITSFSEQLRHTCGIFALVEARLEDGIVLEVSKAEQLQGAELSVGTQAGLQPEVADGSSLRLALPHGGVRPAATPSSPSVQPPALPQPRPAASPSEPSAAPPSAAPSSTVSLASFSLSGAKVAIFFQIRFIFSPKLYANGCHALQSASLARPPIASGRSTPHYDTFQ